jgi:hypothetical protein
MASWADVVQRIQMLGATPSASDDVWFLELRGRDESRTQRIAVIREVMAPDMEFLQLKSAFALLEEVDAADVIRRYGQMLAGAIGFTPLGSENGGPHNGMLHLVTNVPLACLDLADPHAFLLYLSIFAQAADQMENQVSITDVYDRF